MFDYETTTIASTGAASAIFAVLGMYMLFLTLISLVMLIAQWKLFTKAGKPGWAAIVPIYNMIVLIETAGMPGWNIVFFMIPIFNIYFMFKLYIELAKKFGKSSGFGVAMVFFSVIFVPLLAFGSAKYEGNVDSSSVQPQPVPQNDASVEPLVKKEKYCANCGTKLPMDATSCFMCGSEIK